MAKAIFTRRFDATDTKIGVSVRVYPSDQVQTFPAWVVDKAVAAGAAEAVARTAKKDQAGD